MLVDNLAAAAAIVRRIAAAVWVAAVPAVAVEAEEEVAWEEVETVDQITVQIVRLQVHFHRSTRA